jgi:hypothetical protein
MIVNCASKALKGPSPSSWLLDDGQQCRQSLFPATSVPPHGGLTLQLRRQVSCGVASSNSAGWSALPLPVFPSLPALAGQKADPPMLQQKQAQQVATEDLDDSMPILSCAGGGIFFFWEIGVIKYLIENFDLGGVRLLGASAGALVAVLAACDIDPDRAVRAAHRVSIENDVWGRPRGLAGIWASLIRRWLADLLPADAAERCNGRVKVVVTEAPFLRLRYLDRFESKEDLIDALSEQRCPLFSGCAWFTYFLSFFGRFCAAVFL